MKPSSLTLCRWSLTLALAGCLLRGAAAAPAAQAAPKAAARPTTAAVTVITTTATQPKDAPTTGALATAKPTKDNLAEAIEAATNAQARYLAYATKAATDGYGPLASLLRAEARASQIETNRLITEYKVLSAGADPHLELHPPQVGTTAQNLRAELTQWAPKRLDALALYRQKAAAERNRSALRAFTAVRQAERERTRWLGRAEKQLDAQWRGAAKDFYVCPECGKTVDELKFNKCPNCLTDVQKFIKIN